jgi:CelD/BcsL family acetyltransferase involved in cellulose biosynthesis
MTLPLRCLPIKRLTTTDIAEWKRLSRAAIEPNPFQEPEFVLTLAEHQQLPENVRLLIVPSAMSNDWLAACVIRLIPATLTRPLSRLRSFRPLHAYLDHPLIDRSRPEAAAQRLLTALSDCQLGHGLRLHMAPLQGPVCQLLDQAASSGDAAPFREHVWSRAEYNREDLNDDPLVYCSKARRKSLRRCWRNLEVKGPVGLRIQRPSTGDYAAIDRFLKLEHSGWKRDCGTSLLANERDAMFFREMLHNFADDGSVIIGELEVGGKAVASTCNLLRGDTLFALKVGWDPAYASGSPGMWSELLLPHAVFAEIPELQQIDSCAKSGSHLESIWPRQRAMVDIVYTWSYSSTVLSSVRQKIRSARTFAGEWFRAASTVLSSSDGELERTPDSSSDTIQRSCGVTSTR